jgi:hypothetical protein
MSQGCGSECKETASIDECSNKKEMIAQAGNFKFTEGEIHPQCDGCLKSMHEHGKLMIMYDNDVEMVEWAESLIEKNKNRKES